MLKRTILFVVPQLSHGGSNKSLECILSKLDTSLFDIKIVSLKTNEEYEPYFSTFKQNLIEKSGLYNLIEGTTLIKKGFNAFKNYLHLDVWKYVYSFEAKRLQKKYNFYTVIGFEESYATVFASYFENVKKVAWMHCDYNLYKVYSGGRDEHKLYSRFDQIVAVSQFAKRVFLENFPEAIEKTSVIYNILDCEKIQAQLVEEMKESKFKTDTFTMVSVGRISEVKQFELIPDFAHQIKEINPNAAFRWYIIGDGDEYLKDIINKKIAEYGLADTVILLGSKKNPYPYVKQADLLVCTSRTESWSYVINEAKVLHTPVVTLRCGSSEEVVEDGVTGYICEKAELPEILCRMITNDGQIYSQIRQSVTRFEYDNESIIHNLVQLL